MIEEEKKGKKPVKAHRQRTKRTNEKHTQKKRTNEQTNEKKKESLHSCTAPLPVCRWLPTGVGRENNRGFASVFIVFLYNVRALTFLALCDFVI